MLMREEMQVIFTMHLARQPYLYHAPSQTTINSASEKQSAIYNAVYKEQYSPWIVQVNENTLKK
jgi:hypothetical protein